MKRQSEAWKKTAERYESEPDKGEGRRELQARAIEAQKKSNRAMAAYHQYELASAALQIAIVLASAEIITGVAAMLWISAGLGAIGVIFCVLGFFAPTAIHLI